jgi:hypothetical protein
MTPIAQMSLPALLAQIARSNPYNIHRLAVPTLVEDFRRHISRRTTSSSQDVELLLVHDSTQAEVGNQ